MKLQQLIIPYLLLLVASPVLARQYDFRHFTVEHGLPSPKLYQILQDREGYLWFATDNGVSRYDGHAFRNFTTADGFTDYGAFRMLEDSQGRIWFTTFSGNICWYRDGKFTPFTYSYNGSQLKVSWIVEDAQRALWLSTAEGIVLRLQPDGSIRPISLTNKKPGNRKITHSLPVQGGVVFFAEGFYFISDDLRVEPRPYHSEMPVLARFFRLRDGTVVLTNHKGIHAIDARSQRLLLPFGPRMQSEILDMYEDSEGNIWVGSTDGVRCFSRGVLSYTAMQHLLKDRMVTYVLRDREGNYWFTTDNGAFMLSSRNVAMYREQEGLSTRQIVGMDLFGERELLLVARDGTLYQWKNGAIERFAFSCSNAAPLFPDITTLTWLGGNSTLLRLPSGIGLRVEKDGLHTLPNAFPWYRHSDGSLWSYEADGIYRSYKGHRERVYPRLDSTYIYSLHEKITVDTRNRVWIGTRQGLYRQDAGGLLYYGDIEPRLRTLVVGIVASRDGSVWAATKGHGVFWIQDTAIMQITIADGLAGDNCELIVPGENGNIWVAGRAGLSRLARVHNRAVVARTYATGNILPATNIVAVRQIGDTVYVAGSEGLMVFDEQSISLNTTPPPVYISNVTVGGRVVPFGTTCELDYQSGVVVVEYSGIVFRKPGVRSYRYRLLSADTSWNTTHSRSVQFPSLEPGSYVLEVLAQNNDGLWSTVPAKLTLVVRPPYWRTWWFRVIVGGTGVILAVGGGVLVLRRRDRQNAVQRTLLEMELRALRSQMNPHFVFNALNSIQDFILHKQSRTANLYLAKFARLMRMILEYSRQSSITLDNELEFLQLYIDLEQLRFDPSFTYQIKIDPALNGSLIRIPPMILQPVVENAIKHGLASHSESGVLSIAFEKRSDMLYCTIEDNGIGRQEAMRRRQQTETKYESIGLSNIRERLALAHGKNKRGSELLITDLYDQHGEPAGTRVELALPLS